MTERELFSNALQKPTAAERSDYLDQACGNDSSLRERIEKLLAKQSGLGSFMEHPPVEEHLTELADTKILWDQIVCPVVIIHGEQDSLVPWENAVYAVDRLTVAQVEFISLPEEDHFILWSQKDLVVEKILEIFAKK